MSDYAEMADGPIEPPAPVPEPPYIRYTPWVKTDKYDTRTLADKIDEMAAAMRKMQESICHLELQVHRLMNPGEES